MDRLPKELLASLQKKDSYDLCSKVMVSVYCLLYDLDSLK